jgi:hypothetical protein
VAECTIQTFKDTFIAALATTDLDFPIQLWDQLTPQILNCLNMMRASCINPSKPPYKTLYGPCDWNQYPLAPLGCKAAVYKDGNTIGSWVSRGVDGWYLGPSMENYCCDVYYILETRAYHVSGSTELFPQHCQLPDVSPHQHLRALTNKPSDLALQANATPKGKHLLHLLHMCACTSPSSSCYPGRTKGGQTQQRTQSTTMNNQRRTDHHHPEYYGSSGYNEVAQPNGKTYIKSYATAPQTCNKEQYTGHCANSTCCPDCPSTRGNPNIPPNSVGSTFTYCHVTCHQCTHQIQDQKMPGHICTTRFV